MKLRVIVSLSTIAAIISIVSCSSGLGNNLPPQPVPATSSTTNLPVGLDLGFVPTDPVGEGVVAGVSVPAIGTAPARDVVLLAFTTAADAADGDGLGTALSRDTVGDGNAASDVFVAALSAQDVETRAFSQSLAGKFRHPRCMTCHSMQVDGTTAFLSAAASGEPHQGPLPGSTFPSNDPATCATCHVSSTNFPVPGWQAPAASFDLRTKTVAELAVAAQNIPIDETEHFISDPRVLWALDSGILPQVGGRNGIADDDHDGVDEPEDRDGIPRLVPGGSAAFIREIEEWNASGNIVTAATAVQDVTLVSRQSGSSNAGNGASSRPQVCWVPNSSFTAPGTIGTLYVVFQSEASDLVAGDTNSTTDVFRTAVRLNSDANGVLDLVVDGNAVLCSTVDSVNEGNAASTKPVIGGANGEWIAFESLATNLVAGFTDNNGPTSHDVFARNIDSNLTFLVSRSTNGTSAGGGGGSEAPAIDAAGRTVGFESDATDLIADDTNAVRDVFYARVDGGTPFTVVRASVGDLGAEGTGGASSNASVHTESGGRTLVAYQSAKTDLAAAVTATTNVYLYDSGTGSSTLLNQRASPTGNALGDGDARRPVIGGDGALVTFESDAGNIDVLRDDNNKVTDVFLVETAQVALGNVLPYRYSLTTAEAADGNGPSTNPVFGSFAGTGASFAVGFATYTTAATNLGTSDSTNVMVTFIDETSGVLAEFTATPTAGVAPVTVQFTDQSSGAPSSWAWDFDNDGTVDSTAQNPSFTFTTPGIYSVKLVAGNQNSQGEVTKTDFVRAIGVPTAAFTATPTSGPATLTVAFTDTSTELPTSWSWDFGDGSALSTAQNPTHDYTTPGIYTVTLTATNEAGTASTTRTDLVQVFTPVSASFTRSPTAGIVPFSVNFTNTSIGAASYEWDFDEDGVIDSTDENPSFQYTTANTFDVTLTATGPGGTDTFTFTDCVTASGAVTASFAITVSASPVTSAYEGVNVTFTSTSSGSISLLEWDFDNNPATVEATGSPVVRTFSTGASNTVFAVRLTASGPGGTGVATQNLTIVPDSITAAPIPAAKDTTIYSAFVGNCNPANVEIAGGSSFLNPTSYGFKRALLEFDVAGNIPAGATILTAQLDLTCTRAPLDNGNRTFTLHRVTTEWGEVNPSPGGLIGGGTTGASTVAASTGDATWSSPTFPTGSWSGGSFDATASSSRSVGSTAGPGPHAITGYSWNTSTKMVSDVQSWLTPANNHGWILRGPETLVTATARAFGSRTHPTTAFRPSLNITYRPALP